MSDLSRRHFWQLLALGAIGAAAPMCANTAGSSEPQDDAGQPLPPGAIVVKPASRGSEISPLLFGSSIEWTDSGNGLYDDKRHDLRADVIDQLRPLRIPVFRFPGGILADHYHWRDGVGLMSARPRRRNPMDNSEHGNAFGTDEYIRFLKAVSAEPLITANAGTGSFDELSEWHKYFRAAGLPVKYWELGNEIYLSEPREHATIPGNDKRIYHPPAEYAATAKDWATRLRAQDPSVLVGGIAGTYNTSKENRDWLAVLLDRAAPDLDFVALHNAFAPLVMGKYDFGDGRKRRDAYRAMFAQAAYSAEDSRSVEQKWAAASPRKPVRVAITEHFPLFGGGGGQKEILRILDQSRTMAAALYTASLVHGWMRQNVWLATYNLTLSKWFGALLTDTDKGLVKTPTYHVFDLYRNRFGSRLVGVSQTSPTFSSTAVGTVAKRDQIEYLDTVAAADSAGVVSLAVICRRLAGSVNATIDGMPGATVDTVTLAADVPEAINGPGLTDTTRAQADIQLRRSMWKFSPGQTYTFPANSITLLRWPAA